jgi:hypothetical protein
MSLISHHRTPKTRDLHFLLMLVKLCLGEPASLNLFAIWADTLVFLHIGDCDLIGLVDRMTTPLVHEEVFNWLWINDFVPVLRWGKFLITQTIHEGVTPALTSPRGV